jgi:hypothetical protein
MSFPVKPEDKSMQEQMTAIGPQDAIASEVAKSYAGKYQADV